LKHLNKHLPGTKESAKLLQKEGAVHVITDKATLSRAETAFLEQGQLTGTDRGTERYGLMFEEPIGYRISQDGSRIPLNYAELKLGPDGRYHIIPRTGPAR
jgi:hypothetical protein